MNCEDFLPALETGGFFRRVQARRHAARCPRCAAAGAALAATKRQLAIPEQLSPRARHLWLRAADEVTMSPSMQRAWMPMAIGLGLAACVLLAVIEMTVRKEPFMRPSKLDVVPSISRPKTEVVSIDPATEVSRLLTAVNRLDGDLQRLRHDAERLHARQRIAMGLDRFDQW